VHPRRPRRVGWPTPRDRDTPPGFVLGRERHGQGPRSRHPRRAAAIPVVRNGQLIHPDPAVGDHGGDGGAHPRASRATAAGSRCRPRRRESPVLQYDRLVERAREGHLLHVDCCRGHHPRPAIAATILRGMLGEPPRPIDDLDPHRVFVRQRYQLVAAQAWRASRTASATAMPAGCHACHAHPHHGGQ